MAEQQGFYISVDGQEVAVTDFVNAGRTFGLAGDRVFASLLQLPVYDGTNVYKTALPISPGYAEGSGGASASVTAIVSPAGASGSVTVNPFLAIIGSRQAVGGSPTDPTWTGPRANLSDIRTSVWTGATTLSQAQALAANSSGNTRLDLIYATVSVDVAAGSVVRRQKDPSTGVVSTASLPTYLANPVVIGVVTGTPSGSPAIPSLPADSGGNYNVAIAVVRVPTAFTSSSTVAPQDIRDVVGDKNLTNGGGQTVASVAESLGVMSGPMPATGNNDRAATYATNFPWSATGGTRPPMFLPPGMVGGTQLIIEIDDANTPPSHINASIVDDSIDWRNRFVLVFATGGGNLFANDPAWTSGSALPPTNTTGGVTNQLSNTMRPFFTGLGLVFTTVGLTGVSGGSASALTVNLATGNMQWRSNGTQTGVKWFFWVFASAQFPNL